MNYNKQNRMNGFPMELSSLKCELCKGDLLNNEDTGLYVLVKDPQKNRIVDLYLSCKGGHDKSLERAYNEKGYTTEYYELGDMKNPILWVINVMQLLTRLQKEHNFTNDAFEKYKKVLWETFPYICRELNEEEVQRFRTLQQFDAL